MNYKLIYEKLVTTRKSRGLDKNKLDGYFEKHHILPKCLGGDNSPDNLVLLTSKEHILAHRLLVEIYPDNLKIIQSTSAILMKNAGRRKNGSKISTRTIVSIRDEYSKHIRELSLRQVNKDVSEEIRNKISTANTGKIIDENTKLKLKKTRRHYIIQDKNGNIYNSIKDCARSTGKSESTIKWWLSKRPGEKYTLLEKKGNLPRKVKGPNGQVYDSIRQCAKSIGKDFNTIKKWIEKYPELGYSYYTN